MQPQDGPSKLFVGDIGNNRKSDLSRLFSKYGEISTIYVDENKRFGFVEFTSSNDAHRALRHTNNKTVNGSRLRVEYAKSDKIPRDNRPVSLRERSPASSFYNHLQVTANRLPPLNFVRQSYYQYRPSTILTSSSTSRGRSLTPPSLKNHARLSSMNHLRTQDLYPPYHSHNRTLYPYSSNYRTYGDPYVMQRLPPSNFLPPVSSSPPSSHIYRDMRSSSGPRHYSPAMPRKRTHRSRSRTERNNSTSRQNSPHRGGKHRRRTGSSSSASSSSTLSSKEQREHGPRTPSSIEASNEKSPNSRVIVSTSEQKSISTSSDSSSDEDKRSSLRKFQNNESSQKNSTKNNQKDD